MDYYSDNYDFLSIVIPAYNRYERLKELVYDIHKYADIPFELIISDDGSLDNTTSKIFEELRDHASTIILNNGYSFGLSGNINRAVNIASSNYILMMNADLRIKGSFFKNLLDILKEKFIGIVMPIMGIDYISGPNKFKTKNGTKFNLSTRLGWGSSLAFRKDFFEKIGKFDNFNCCSGNADVSFMCRTIKNGYFLTNFEHNNQIEIPGKNDNFKDSTITGQTHDCSFPKLFHVKDYENLMLSEDHKKRCDFYMQKSYKAIAGNTNIDYWNSYLSMLINNNQDIDWEISKMYGQYMWKEEIRLLLKESMRR